MERVINGKKYSTETAELLASDESTECKSDFRWWYEELYRTKKGEYFLAGEGHAMSHWSESVGQNSSGPGSGIRVLTDAEAREWVEEHDNGEYETIFGKAEEA